MLRAILIDDEENGRISLRRKLENYCPEVEIVGEGGGAIEGIALIEHHKPDIVFLDVEMPKMNGFDLLERLSPIDFHLIFTTAHDHYAIDAIRNDAFDYLLKPVDIEELKRAIARITRLREKTVDTRENPKKRTEGPENEIAVKSNLRKTLNRIAIPTMEGLVFLDTASITHIEAQSNYTIFHFTQQPKLTVSKTLKEIEDMLPGDVFFRIHHSHIVNLNYVRKYVKGNGGHIELQDGSIVDVSRRKKDEFLRMIGY